MTDRPIAPACHITLTVPKELDRDDAKAWYGCVRANAPPGSLMAMQVMKPRKGLTAVSMVHTEGESGHQYIVPLGRNLSTEEGEEIFNAWVVARPDMEDCQIEASAAVTAGDRANKPAIVGRDRYGALCMAMAKQRHQKWVKERTDAGWRFGPTLSLRDKVHPLLRTWEEIPERYRQPDTETPQMVMDLMTQNGYAIVDQSELSAVMQMLRSVT